MTKRQLSPTERRKAAELVACFSALVHAWATGNCQQADELKSELHTAGVYVRLGNSPTGAASQRGGPVSA